jgi:hypothetical protein
MRRIARVGMVVAVAVLMAGCGSKNETSSSTTSAAGRSGGGGTASTLAPGKPACELLSRDDVAKALGNPVGDPAPGNREDCSWGTDVDGGTSVTITASKPGRDGAGPACRALHLGQPSEATHENVSGVGSSGVWAWQKLADPIVQGSLAACWDDSAVLVLLTGEKDQAVLRDTAKGLAQTVHGRL